MLRICYLLLGLLALSAPTAAMAQADSPLPPPVVQTLSGPGVSPNSYLPWVGAAAGATAAIVGMNVWTGGALLAPSLGPALSGMLGGSWLGAPAMAAAAPGVPVAATHGVFEMTSLIAVGVAGGVFGHWLGSR